VVAKVRERLAISKKEAQKFDAERFNLKKLSELEVRKQYQLKISNRFAAVENLNVSEDINRAWENIKENIKSQLKTVQVCMNGSSINHGLMQNVHNF
jgi:hypothetical protein